MKIRMRFRSDGTFTVLPERHAQLGLPGVVVPQKAASSDPTDRNTEIRQKLVTIMSSIYAA